MPEIARPPAPLSPESSESREFVSYPHVHWVHGEAGVASAHEPIKWTAAIPDSPTINALGLIANGFCAIKRSSREFREALAAEGLATVSYDPARVHSSLLDLPRHTLNPQALHYESLAGIDSSLASHPALGELAAAPRILIGHSMGNLAALDYAVNHPESIATMISIGGVGMERRLGLKLVARSKDMVLHDIGPAIVTGKFNDYGLKGAARLLHYVWRNPMRTGTEAVSCMVSDKRRQVHQLAALGVRHVVLMPEDDDFFYPVDTIRTVHDVVDHWEIMEGMKHACPQTDAKKVATIVMQALGAQNYFKLSA